MTEQVGNLTIREDENGNVLVFNNNRLVDVWEQTTVEAVAKHYRDVLARRDAK